MNGGPPAPILAFGRRGKGERPVKRSMTGIAVLLFAILLQLSGMGIEGLTILLGIAGLFITIYSEIESRK